MFEVINYETDIKVVVCENIAVGDNVINYIVEIYDRAYGHRRECDRWSNKPCRELVVSAEQLDSYLLRWTGKNTYRHPL